MGGGLWLGVLSLLSEGPESWGWGAWYGAGESAGLWPLTGTGALRPQRQDRLQDPGAGVPCKGAPSLPGHRPGQRWALSSRHCSHGARLLLRAAWSHPAKARPEPLACDPGSCWAKAGRIAQHSSGAWGPLSIVCVSCVATAELLSRTIWRPLMAGEGPLMAQR